MTGGTGSDVYVVGSSTSDIITENLNQGNDTVNSYVNWTLGKNLENLRLQGSSKIKGIGNALNNTITGNAATTLWMAKQAATLYMVLVATTPLMVAAVLTILWWVGQHLYR